jgi:hypothetical protein
LGSLEVNDGVVVFEHVDFVNILKGLHAYICNETIMIVPNFLMADLSFLSSFTFT